MNGHSPVRRHPFSLYLMLLLGLAAGILLDRSGILPGSTHRAPAGLGKTFEPFWEAWTLVEKNYVDRDAVDSRKMTYGAIDGMLTSLGDSGHTTFLTPEELERLESGLEGQMEGIGAQVSVRKRRPAIVLTMPGSPARAAGLKPGDVMIEVNDKPVAGLSLQRVVEQVRGPAGTVVRLRIQREGEAKPLDFAIKRARVEVPDVTWHALPGTSFAHLAIHNFGARADSQLRSALEDINKQGLKGIVLDVRGNPGGLKDQAVAVTSEFLKDGTVFIEQDAQGHRKEVPVEKGGAATDIPVALLIDEGTASSAEIFAGALQDYQRGQLIGARTFGTGTVLKPFKLSDGSAILLAVAEWLTPKGRKIWHKGISPDVEVALLEDARLLFPEEEEELTADALKHSDDLQLLKAIAVLTKAAP